MDQPIVSIPVHFPDGDLIFLGIVEGGVERLRLRDRRRVIVSFKRVRAHAVANCGAGVVSAEAPCFVSSHAPIIWRARTLRHACTCSGVIASASRVL